ncbi:MAG: ECF transporter S component [Oscillospiraceae bacterium]|jgi:uncharacterized membrane protein|nr:ECF transporter S component [Oscillospiraceae bacterium]
MNQAKAFDTRKLVLLALLTAIVVVLQSLAAVLPIYPFTLTLTLVPMVIGAALVNVSAGGWLGLVFGLVVLLTGNANAFLAVSAPATILVVLLKGTLAGLASGAVYKLLAKKNRTVAVIISAVICPIVNTGVFVAGCYAFFLPTLKEWGGSEYSNVTAFIFLGIIGFNFISEMIINLVLSPVIVRLVQYRQGKKASAS